MHVKLKIFDWYAKNYNSLSIFTHFQLLLWSLFAFLEMALWFHFSDNGPDAEDNTSGPLNRGGIADVPLLWMLLVIRQNSREPSFWEVMDSFVLLAYASLAASRTLL